MLVASGIGLSAALPLVLQMRTCEREVYLVWTTRSLEQLAYHLPLLTKCSACFIYYTGKEEVSDKVESVIAEHPHVGLYNGRPKLDAILAWLVSQRNPTIQRMLQVQPSTAHIAGRLSRTLRISRETPWVATLSRKLRISRETPCVAPSEMLQALNADPDEVKLALPTQTDVGSVIDGIDVSRAQQLCRSELHTEESWCVLYCGAVKQIRASLMNACTKSRFHYAEESFNW